MKLAADLIKTKHLSANAVAELVEYKSYSNFNLMFKNIMGVRHLSIIMRINQNNRLLRKQ